MVFLKLLIHALGSVLMYWGFVLLFLSPWFVGVILIVLANHLWNKITGKNEEWKWFLGWCDTVDKLIHRFKFEWIGWIPGILIQAWYAGYAADLVQTSTLNASIGYAIAIHSAGVLGMVVAAVVFYWLYRQFVEVHLGRWVYGLVGGVSLIAYVVLLEQPQTAALLSAAWKRVISVLLVEFIESIVSN